MITIFITSVIEIKMGTNPSAINQGTRNKKRKTEAPTRLKVEEADCGHLWIILSSTYSI